MFKIVILKRSINIDFNYCYRYNNIDHYIKKCFTIKRIIFVKINVKKLFANIKKEFINNINEKYEEMSEKIQKKTKKTMNFRRKTNSLELKRRYKIDIRI